jgi:AcrR family transcriptional regulator
MAPSTTRAERKAQTREQLIQAALRCFEADGFAATTLERIAEEAGVTTGAVYSNFTNKEALFLELIGRIDPQRVELAMLGDQSCSLADRFRSFGEVNAQTNELPPKTMATWYEVRSFALRNERAGAAAHDVLLDYMEAWGERIDRLAPAIGANPVVSGEVAALIIQALLDGLRGMHAFLPDRITPKLYGEATRLLAHLFDEPAESP